VKLSTPLLALLGVSTFGLAAPVSAVAQYPRAERGQFEIRGLDFRSRGAWRVKAANIRARRQALLASGNFTALNSLALGASASAVTGQFYVPVVPIRFSNTDTTTLYSPAQYQSLFFSPTTDSLPYSLKTFYEQLSNGRISMSGTVFPWVRADSTDVYYEDGCNGVGVKGPCPDGGARFGSMLLAALAKISSGPDSLTVWAQFDNDGPDGIPNSGDDDGYVDFVNFLQPKVDGACGTSAIWSHRWVIDAWNGGSPYVTKTNRAGGGKIKISDYTIQSGVGGRTACSGSSIMPIGTVAHETGHAFGLPDLYDTQVTNPTAGIGEYGLMGSGNYARAYSPSRMSGWSLLELGWVLADTLRATGTITLDPVATSDSVLILKTQTPGEYYLLENRAALESDTAQMNPACVRASGASCAKSPGLYVWHIDQARIDQGTFSNSINTGTIQGVAVVQADGLNSLRVAPYNRGDPGDAYPGTTGNTSLDGGTLPALRTNAGTVVPGRIDSIRIGAGAAVLFRYRLEHLLHATTTGTGVGAIQSSVPGSLQDGLSITPGTVVTLTAQHSADNAFGGWGGDTTSSDSVLVLTMNRNWQVTALFSFYGTVAPALAASDLMGIPALSAGARDFLDHNGNQNGVYDLGDFLRLVDQSSPSGAAAVEKGATR
jgi:M6 family metalloprotease-like protein